MKKLEWWLKLWVGYYLTLMRSVPSIVVLTSNFVNDIYVYPSTIFLNDQAFGTCS